MPDHELPPSDDPRLALAELLPDLQRFLVHHCGDAAVGGDLAQETLARAIAAASTLRSRAALRPWLFRIAVHVLNDHLRRKAQESRLRGEGLDLDQQVDCAGEAPEARALRAELDAAIRAAILDLPERQRSVLLLHSVRDFDHRAIARTLGISAGAVKVALFHAREAVCRRLARTIEDLPARRRTRRWHLRP
jgi:RNA polymerase sigma factor (sigma-70 family)